MALYRERGVVLRTIKLGEADRIITIATEHRGKVRAVAKGVRKTKSRFGARLEPLTHLSLQLYETRGDLDIVTQVETIDAFRAVREDLDRLTQATALLEAVDHLAQEGEENPRLLQMLLGALRTLEAGPAPLVVPAFFWKLLAQEGFHPLLDECASCGSGAEVPGVRGVPEFPGVRGVPEFPGVRGVPEFAAFDLEVGGVLCRTCANGAPRLSSAALALLRRMLGGDLVTVLAEPATSAGFEVEHLATRALEAHVERRMRSMSLLEHHEQSSR